MTRLDALLAYQQTQLEKEGAENAVRSTPSRVRLNKLYKLLKGQQATIARLSEELEARMAQVKRLADRTEQLEKQLSLAEELDLPVIVHEREAHGDAMDILRAHPRATGVFHCFSGSPEMALWLVERGWYIGFTGVVTFKNARRAVEAVQALPLDRILIETDCPYMAPEPYRGRRNDSRYVPLVAAKIAALRGLTPEEAGALTAANARRLFRIPDGEEASACVTP